MSVFGAKVENEILKESGYACVISLFGTYAQTGKVSLVLPEDVSCYDIKDIVIGSIERAWSRVFPRLFLPERKYFQ